MGIINYGIGEGLAYKHDFAADMNRLQTNQILDDQAKINYQNQVSILGDQLQAKHLETTWDNQQLKTFVEAKTKEIGTFVMQNPDYKMSPALNSRYKAMVNEIQDNDFVRNSMNANTNYGMLTKYIAENPGAESDPDIQLQLQQYENYNKTGSVDGISTNGKKYIFSSPDSKFDLNKVIGDVYSTMEATTVYDKSGVGIGATRTYADPEQLKARADALLQSSQGFNVKRSWQALSPQQQSLYNGDIYTWISTLGSSYVAQSVKAGSVFAPQRTSGGAGGAKAGGGAAAAGFSAFYNDLSKTQPYQTWYSPHTKTLLPISEAGDYTVNTNGVQIQTIGADGVPSFINIKSLAGQNVTIDPKSVGTGINGSNNEPYATVRMVVPITDEMVNGTMPILKNNSSWYEGWDINEANDTTNDPAYAGIVELEKDADGNNTGKVVIRAAVPLYATESTVRAYDVAATTPAIAAKAEGLGLGQMDAQNQLSMLQSMGMVKFATMPDGSYIGQAPDGNWYDANGNVVK